jgi:tetratricopeptide (TPR) repeat protein
VLAALILALLPAAMSSAPRSARTPSAREQVLYYRARIAQTPDQFPLYAQLAKACLDRARETHDPSDLGDARAAAAKSISLQPSYEAYLVAAQIESFAHRFERARQWARKAQRASVNGRFVPDPLVRSILVECALGLGEDHEAAALLEDGRVKGDDFWTAASLGKWLAASGRTAEAVSAFETAEGLAGREGENAFAAWAQCAAAKALLDAGRVAEARGYVERAEALDPGSILVRLHRARLEEASGDPGEALRVYEEMIPDNPDPEVHRLAFVAARRAGDREAAARHFEAAERGFQAAIRAGEVYTLGPLAQLYADAGVHPRRARELARENLRYKRDRAARATAEAAERASSP